MATIEERAFKTYPGQLGPSDKPCLDDDYRVTLKQREAYITACEEYESLPKIRGWVARDNDGHLQLFTGDKPHQEHNQFWDNSGKRGNYVLSLCNIENEVFPEITWESEPVDVELLIRKV